MGRNLPRTSHRVVIKPVESPGLLKSWPHRQRIGLDAQPLRARGQVTRLNYG